MDRLRKVPLKSKIGLSLYEKVGILVESDPDKNRFVLQIPTFPDDPNRTAWVMEYCEDRDALILVAAHTEKVSVKQDKDKILSIQISDD